MAACLTVAARFCGSGNAAVQHSNGMENALGLSAGEDKSKALSPNPYFACFRLVLRPRLMLIDKP